jgi:outer membrane protein insertion porin family
LEWRFSERQGPEGEMRLVSPEWFSRTHISKWRVGFGNALRHSGFCAAVGLWSSIGAANCFSQSIPAGTPASSATPSRPATTLVQATPATASQSAPGLNGLVIPPPTVAAQSIWQARGLRVNKIEFDGVSFEAADTLPSELTQKVGEVLDPEKVRESTRRLFNSGRYRNITVREVREGNGLTLIFSGDARYFVGRVTILGVKDERLTSLLEFATKLDPGTPFQRSELQTGIDGIKQTLQQNGYFEPQVTVTTVEDVQGAQVDATFTVTIGPQARVGQVLVEGTDPGLTTAEFRKKGKLKAGSKVTRETVGNALTRLRTQYQKKDRLEATISLQKQTYNSARKAVDYDFRVSQGPEVKVLVEGIKIAKSRIHLLVPIFEEGTIDNDLLNEGQHNIREFMEQQGYFDASVDVKVIGEGTSDERVVYTVDRGVKHKVLSVDIDGNKYFSDDLLRERLRVQKADNYLRSGRYSQSLVSADVSSIQAIYRANGFDQAKVTTDVSDVDDNADGKPLKFAQIRVKYKIDEGAQQKFGAVRLAGVDASRQNDLKALLNAQSGQPFSLITLSGDRDAVLGYYVSHGFDQARIEIKQSKESGDLGVTDVTLNVTEGEQVFINHVLLSGLHHTRLKVVERQVLVHPGDPLDQSALLETQRNLYNLALFNEVVAAVQNPTGDVRRKNVVLQLTEARRWDVTYGFGFEAQTGQPNSGTISEASRIQLGLPSNAQYSQEGSAGVSPRVSVDVARINLRGSENSLTLHTTYGLLEKIATLSFQYPHLRGRRNLSGTVSGGYSNVQNITTFKASTVQFDFRVTQKVKRADTFLYDFQYRRVKVDPNSLQVSANLIPILSQPVLVAGPGVTWFHDTRQPGPLNASKGMYLSVQEFLASSKFGSGTDFNRVDVTNSTYYQFGKRKYVLARNTRIGFEKSFGVNPNLGNTECIGVLLTTNPSCSAVPLPERLYAGGATSHRGFGINGAGPRDLQTGYPVGGTAAFVNTIELRLPAATLPYVGDGINFVIFHDMGNVFQNAGDLLPSFARFKQPNRDTCKVVTGVVKIGTCNFNYFSHAIGLGARYKTPVGPIRVDFSYNLNPPIYPVIYDFNNSDPHVGQSSHFGFFFSIGESF